MAYVTPPSRPPQRYDSTEEAQYRLGVYQALRGIRPLLGTASAAPVSAPAPGDPLLLLVTEAGVTSLQLWDGSAWQTL